MTEQCMGLDCIPLRVASDGVTSAADDEQTGKTHGPQEPCPFKDDFPVGMMAPCCSLRGKVAAYELDALGETELAGRMYTNMTLREAAVFALELRAAADRLEKQHAKMPEAKGAAWHKFDGKTVTTVHSSFDEALAAIREAARWYEKVSLLGFGVFAWY